MLTYADNLGGHEVRRVSDRDRQREVVHDEENERRNDEDLLSRHQVLELPAESAILSHSVLGCLVAITASAIGPLLVYEADSLPLDVASQRYQTNFCSTTRIEVSSRNGVMLFPYGVHATYRT